MFPFSTTVNPKVTQPDNGNTQRHEPTTFLHSLDALLFCSQGLLPIAVIFISIALHFCLVFIFICEVTITCIQQRGPDHIKVKRSVQRSQFAQSCNSELYSWFLVLQLCNVWP